MSCSGYIKKGWWTPLLRINGVALAKYVLHEVLRRNTISKARKNISAHYDLVSGFCYFFLKTYYYHLLEIFCNYFTYVIESMS